MHFETLLNKSPSTNHVAFVTVFAIYNSTVQSKPDDLVTVGNISYGKVEKSMAILNVFINFIQVYLVMFHNCNLKFDSVHKYKIHLRM